MSKLLSIIVCVAFSLLSAVTRAEEILLLPPAPEDASKTEESRPPPPSQKTAPLGLDPIAPDAPQAEPQSSIEPSVSAPASAEGSTSASSSPGAAENSLLDGIVFPGILKPLLAGRIDEVPDDRTSRQYLASVYGVMSQMCGARGTGMQMNLLGYLEPKAAPGRDLAEFGMEKSMEFLLDLGRLAQSGDIRDLATMAERNSYQLKEGVEDGTMLISRLQCLSDEFRSFEANIERLISRRSGREPAQTDTLELQGLMSARYRELNGIPDPTEALRGRRIDRSADAMQKDCTARYQPASFCGCLTKEFKVASLDEESWRQIAENFDRIVPLAARRAELKTAINTCVRR